MGGTVNRDNYRCEYCGTYNEQWVEVITPEELVKLYNEKVIHYENELEKMQLIHRADKVYEKGVNDIIGILKFIEKQTNNGGSKYE